MLEYNKPFHFEKGFVIFHTKFFFFFFLSLYICNVPFEEKIQHNLYPKENPREDMQPTKRETHCAFNLFTESVFIAFFFR